MSHFTDEDTQVSDRGWVGVLRYAHCQQLSPSEAWGATCMSGLLIEGASHRLQSRQSMVSTACMQMESKVSPKEKPSWDQSEG